MSNVKDFDAFWAEQGREPLVAKVFGEEYKLPSEMPAALSLRLVRMNMEVKLGKRQETEQVAVEELEAIAAELFGKAVYQSWVDKGIGIEQLTHVLEWALSQYGGTGEDAEGETVAPEETTSTPSSNGGPSSKPTSNGSTESVSPTT